MTAQDRHLSILCCSNINRGGDDKLSELAFVREAPCLHQPDLDIIIVPSIGHTTYSPSGLKQSLQGLKPINLSPLLDVRAAFVRRDGAVRQRGLQRGGVVPLLVRGPEPGPPEQVVLPRVPGASEAGPSRRGAVRR